MPRDSRAGASSTGSSPIPSAVACQRVELPGRHLGGARRHGHAARRVPGPLLPGGLPRVGVHPALLAPGEADGRRLGRGLRQTLEHEIHKYTVDEPNHGKAARRLYNIFRLTGRYAEAAYIRELFDEPVGALYQLAALLRTLDDAADSPGSFQADALVREVDTLIMSAIGALEGPSEAEMVRRLLHVRDAVAKQAAEASYDTELEAARSDAMRAVDEFFSRALRGVPSIAAYLDEVAASAT